MNLLNKKTLVTVSNIPLQEKPSGDLEGTISKSICNQVFFNSIEELKGIIENGYSFSPALFEGSRNKANWRSQKLIVLDFDNKTEPYITVEEVIERSKEHGLTPNFTYNSFSHIKSMEERGLPKFRIGFVLDEEVEDLKEIEYYIKTFGQNIFHESDQACLQPAAFFYPGHDFKVISEEYNSLEVIKNIVATLNYSKNWSREFPKALKTPKNIQSFEIKKGSIQNFDFNKAKTHSPLLSDFLDLNRKLAHYELFALATNLQYIKGGGKLFKETMINYNLLNKVDSYKIEEKLNSLSYIKSVNYYPQNLKNISEKEVYNNLIEIHFKATKPKITVNEEYYARVASKKNLKDAENLLEKKFFDVQNSPEKGIYLFNVEVGLGKTRLLENIKNAIIAFPTHALKDEFSKRTKTPFFSTPERPVFKDVKLSEEYSNCFNEFSHNTTTEFLLKISRNKNDEYSEEDVKTAKQYIKDNKKAIDSAKDISCNILTTHSKVFLQNYDKDILIFDESIINSLIKNETF